MPLISFDGLGIVPIDILQQGTRKVVQYMLDLFRSPDGDPLFRSKLMVVGYESVGKTTILDCLFPLEGWLTQPGLFSKTKSRFTLQGNTLRKYESPTDTTPHKYIFENRQWSVTALPKDFGIKMTPASKEGQQKELELYCGDKETQEVWLSRLRRVCMNEATHGIEIQSQTIDDEITQEYFKKLPAGKGGIELSVGFCRTAGLLQQSSLLHLNEDSVLGFVEDK
jgi:hypothetical protein